MKLKKNRHLMRLSFKREAETKKIPITFDYILHNHILQKEKYIKYLGATIQTNFKHINNNIASVSHKFNLIKRYQKFNPRTVKERAYISQVKHKLIYSSLVGDPHTNFKWFSAGHLVNMFRCGMSANDRNNSPFKSQSINVTLTEEGTVFNTEPLITPSNK